MSVEWSFIDLQQEICFSPVLKKYVRDIIRAEKGETGEILLLFTSNEYLISINRRFLKHDYYTDVITFSNGRKALVAGEVYISVDQVILNAKSLKVDWTVELLRVITHGILHLIGYDDQTESQRSFMRSLEDHYLCQLNIEKVFCQGE